MKIYYDSKKSKEIEEKLLERWSIESQVRGRKFHVYDIVSCQLKYYCRVFGFKKKVSKKNIGIMVFGIVSGKILEELYPKEERQYLTELEDIIEGHIDVYEKLMFPLEGKSSRKRIFKRQDLPIIWVQQLISYMSLTGSEKGWLIIINVFSCQISAFCVEMTNEEILGRLVFITGTTTQTTKAVDEENPYLLKIHPEEYTNCHYKSSCPRREECRERSRKDDKYHNKLTLEIIKVIGSQP